MVNYIDFRWTCDHCETNASPLNETALRQQCRTLKGDIMKTYYVLEFTGRGFCAVPRQATSVAGTI